MKLNLKSTRAKILSITTFIIAFVAVGLILDHPSHKPSSSTIQQAANYVSTNTAITRYTSTQHHFSINFPGTPAVSDITLHIQGLGVPSTTYEKSNSDNTTAYLVSVDDYPAQLDLSDTKARLEGALNGEVAVLKGATLISSSYGTLAGYTSISGHATLVDSGQTFDIYSTCALKGNTLYVIVTVGVPESDFNNFVNSFQLTQ